MALTLHIRGPERPADPLDVRPVSLEAFPATVGRGPECQVRLEDESVSSLHATFFQQDGRYVLRDEASVNGTLVGGTSVEAKDGRLLLHGDIVRIGRFWIQIGIESTEPDAPDLPTHELALGLVSDVLRQKLREHAIVVVEGEHRGAILELPDGEAQIVGRDLRAALRFESPSLSQVHVRIRRRGDEIFVCDGGSRNGSVLGGRRLSAGDDLSWDVVAHLRIAEIVLARTDARPPLDERLGIGRATPSSEVLETFHSKSMRIGEVSRPDVAAVPSSAEPVPSPAVSREPRSISLVVPIAVGLIVAASLACAGWILFA